MSEPMMTEDVAVSYALEGEVYLEVDSVIREDCVHKRWVRLAGRGLLVSRREASTSSKRIRLAAGCAVACAGDVAERSVRVLQSRYTILSLAYKNSKRRMFCFTVTWPPSTAYPRGRIRQFALPDAAAAERWRKALEATVSAVGEAAPAADDEVSASSSPSSAASLAPLPGTSPRPHPPGAGDRSLATGSPPPRAPASHARSASASVLDSDSTWSHVSRGAGQRPSTPADPRDAAACPTTGAAVAAAGGGDGMVRGDSFSQHTEAGSCEEELAQREGGPAWAHAVSPDLGPGANGESASASAPAFAAAPERTWGRFHLVNGIAIWRESPQVPCALADDAEEGGALSTLASFMVSHRIRGPPRQVLRNLLGVRGAAGSAFWAFAALDGVGDAIEPGRAFKATMFPPAPLQRLVAAPRDFFLRPAVRRDDDGSYIVLLQSVDRATCRHLSLAPGHVEGFLPSMGFTIAPLKREYRPSSAAAADVPRGASVMSGRTGRGRATRDRGTAAGADAAGSFSPESLVTLVLSVDLGGWLGSRGAFACLSRALRDVFALPWAEALLMTVVALENKVDQDCFVRGEGDFLPSTDTLEHPSLPAPLASPVADASAFKLGGGGAGAAAGAADGARLAAASENAAPGSEARVGLAAAVSGRGKDLEEAPDTWLPREYYSDPGAGTFVVRGANYLSDRKKVPSEAPVFELAGVELMRSDAAVYHVSRYLPIVRRSTAAFNFVLCFTLPFKGKVHSLVIVLEARSFAAASGSRRSGGAAGDAGDDEDDEESLSPVEICLARFLADTGPLRNAKLKLIPSLARGPWIVRHAVGQTPVMLGKRLKTEYFAEEGYVEADVDISANATAASVTSLVAGSIKSLVFDIGILLEGHSGEELPERLLGAVRLNQLDLAAARELDTSREIPPAPRRPPPDFAYAAHTRRATRVPTHARTTSMPF